MEAKEFGAIVEQANGLLQQAVGDKGGYIVLAFDYESKQMAKITQGEGMMLTGILHEFLTNPGEMKPVVDAALVYTIQEIDRRHREEKNKDRKKNKQS